MLILTIRTDRTESEIGLYDDENRLAYEVWPAHRKLAETIHRKISDVMKAAGVTSADLGGIVIYKGPGSFTGLRIGTAVANALSYSYSAPIIAVGGDNWIYDGISGLLAGRNEHVAVPEYGQPANTTSPKK